MVRLIDAEKFIEEIMSTPTDLYYPPYFGRVAIEQPTVDAVPVVHAYWISDEDETGEYSNTYKCSHCGEIQTLIEGTPKDNGWNYCPHCGAKMDEVTK